MTVLRSRDVPSVPSSPVTPSTSVTSSSRRRHRSSTDSPVGQRRRSARLEEKANVGADDDEKGKGVMQIDEGEGASDGNLIPDGGKADVDVGPASITEEMAVDSEGFAGTSALSGRRARDKALALEAAERFAYFKPEEEVEEDDDGEEGDDVVEEEKEDDGEDWPGPFSTAMKLIQEREERLRARGEKGETLKGAVELGWKPTRKVKFPAVVPSLRELAVKVLAANSEHLESLQGVPGALLKLIAQSVCGIRGMGGRFLRVLVSQKPTEIYVPDCSWVEEEELKEIFRGCNTEELEVLRLDLCGRCLPDDVLSSTLAHSPNSLPKLVSISLVGNYKLSDDGLMLLASSAPMLHSINLSQCCLITSAGIVELLKKLDGVIKELILDDCQNVSGIAILPGLKKLKQLKSISLSRLQDVNDKFIKGLVLACSHLEELGLSGCLKISSRSTKVIGEECSKLHTIDLRNIVKLNDKAIAYLASGCLSFQKLLLQCNDCSDEAIAAFIEASANSLVELSLNNLIKVSNHTALAISRRCSSTLQKLDLSFCRLMSDEALGLIVDSCPHLKVLKLFGCTQVTDLFLNGHSNPGVRIIGIHDSILNHMETPGILGDW